MLHIGDLHWFWHTNSRVSTVFNNAFAISCDLGARHHFSSLHIDWVAESNFNISVWILGDSLNCEVSRRCRCTMNLFGKTEPAFHFSKFKMSNTQIWRPLHVDNIMAQMESLTLFIYCLFISWLWHAERPICGG